MSFRFHERLSHSLRNGIIGIFRPGCRVSHQYAYAERLCVLYVAHLVEGSSAEVT